MDMCDFANVCVCRIMPEAGGRMENSILVGVCFILLAGCVLHVSIMFLNYQIYILNVMSVFMM